MYFGLLFYHRKGINPPTSAGLELAATARPELARQPTRVQLQKAEEQLKKREDDEEIRYIRFLFDSYEPRCLYFEVVECVRKLMLTGMMIFFFPETPSQVCVRLR